VSFVVKAFSPPRTPADTNDANPQFEIRNPKIHNPQSAIRNPQSAIRNRKSVYNRRMLCVICRKRKGKRLCPAKNALICPQCCGEKRIVEIDCPADCVYLSEGQRYQVQQKYARLFRNWDEFQKREVVRLSRDFGDIFRAIESYFAQNRRSLGSDQNLLEALGVIEKSLQTESKGIIYRPAASSLAAETAAKEIEKILEARRNRANITVSHLTSSDAAAIIRVLKEDVSFHIRSGSSYLDFVTRSHPDQKESPRVIVP
jgi:hypothetical protein